MGDPDVKATSMQDNDERIERARLAGLYHDIFETDKRGQAILADLYARFVRRPNPNDFTPEGMLRTFVHTHQREVIEYIVRQINAARGVEDEPPPEGNTE